MGADNAPESGGVIGFNEMYKFVNDHVVNYEHRRFDETPIKIQIIVYCAGAPTVTTINNLRYSGSYTEIVSMLLDANNNLFLSSGNVPVS